MNATPAVFGERALRATTPPFRLAGGRIIEAGLSQDFGCTSSSHYCSSIICACIQCCCAMRASIDSPINRHATIHQHVQQWAQGFVRHWQTFKNALAGWATNLVWDNNHHSHLRVAKVVTILVFCMHIFMRILSTCLEGAWMRKTIGGTAMNPPTMSLAPDGMSVTNFESLWQLKL